MLHESLKNEDPCGRHEKGDGSWWENDARGIPLARVCEKCENFKLKKYRPEILRNPNYETDEPIDPINESHDDFYGDELESTESCCNCNCNPCDCDSSVDQEPRNLGTRRNSGMPYHDHEARMAKAELRDMVKNAKEIYTMIRDNDEIPGWISAYITLASDYMHSVYEFMAELESDGESIDTP